MAKEINIAKDIIKNYEPKDIIRFVTKKLKNYNKESNGENGIYHIADPELQLYIDILSELDTKMNGKEVSVIL